MDAERDREIGLTGVLRQALACAWRTLRLLAARRLHLHRLRLGEEVLLPDGRSYRVFCESTCDGPLDDPVLLAVWFHLKGMPAGARLRRWIFENVCIVNTLLFAGFDGYRLKLWMVDPQTADYAGLYSWNGVAEAERYARYITAVLRPLSRPGTVGYQAYVGLDVDRYLDAPRQAAEGAAA